MPGRSRVTAHKMGEPRAVRHRACTGEHHRAMPGRSRPERALPGRGTDATRWSASDPPAAPEGEMKSVKRDKKRAETDARLRLLS
jgi:hypothetical protein